MRAVSYWGIEPAMTFTLTKKKKNVVVREFLRDWNMIRAYLLQSLKAASPRPGRIRIHKGEQITYPFIGQSTKSL